MYNLQGRIELGVSPERTNVPEAILYDGGAPAKQNLYRVFAFSNTTPSATAFEVPATCPESQELESIHPLKLISKLMTPYLEGRGFKAMPGYSQLQVTACTEYPYFAEVILDYMHAD